MTKKLLLVVFILNFTQVYAKIGANNNFWIIAQDDYDRKVVNGEDVIMRRYIVVPSINKDYKNAIQSADEQFILAAFSYLLQTNRANWITTYIQNCNDTLSIYPLMKGLYYLSGKQYAEAISALEKVENREYTFLKLVLIADCRYELLSDQHNYKAVIGAYQQASDSTQDELCKSIVANRIKFIKYR